MNGSTRAYSSGLSAPPMSLPDERSRFQAEPLAEAGVGELVAILAVDVGDEHGKRVDDQPKLALALLHLASGVNLLGDVHGVDQDAVHLAGAAQRLEDEAEVLRFLLGPLRPAPIRTGTSTPR